MMVWTQEHRDRYKRKHELEAQIEALQSMIERGVVLQAVEPFVTEHLAKLKRELGEIADDTQAAQT